jgi:hypothetical protein
MSDANVVENNPGVNMGSKLGSNLGGSLPSCLLESNRHSKQGLRPSIVSYSGCVTGAGNSGFWVSTPRQPTGRLCTGSSTAPSGLFARENHADARIMKRMEVTIKVPDRLAAEARAHGVSVEVYVQEILAKQTREIAGEQGLQSVRAAISRILELRKGNKLGGFRPQDLVHEGRKY